MEAILAKNINQPKVSQSDQTDSKKAQAQSRATILVADDDFFVIDLLKEFLSGSGYDIVTAGSGEEALLKMGSTGVDMALIDLKMPGMDGLETIERMTATDPDMVTILMTGYPTLDSSVKAIRLGASDYILKPFKLEEVSTAIDRAIKERSIRLEVKSLRKRMSELEKNITEKKDTIKINQNLGRATQSDGHAAKALPSDKLPQ